MTEFDHVFTRLACEEAYKNEAINMYQYDCAQSEHNHRVHDKHEDPKKQRNRETMRHFNCHGTLKVVVGQTKMAVRYRHSLPHVAYVCIDVPEDVKAMIQEAVERKTDPEQVRINEP